MARIRLISPRTVHDNGNIEATGKARRGSTTHTIKRETPMIKTILLAGASALAFAATSAEALTTFGYSGQIVDWVAPKSGVYAIDVYGAQGGAYQTYAGGKGALVGGDVTLTQGEQLSIVVGGQGGQARNRLPSKYGYGFFASAGGGGGGSSVQGAFGVAFAAGGGGGGRGFAGGPGLTDLVGDGGGASGGAFGGGGGGGFAGAGANAPSAWAWVYHDYGAKGGNLAGGDGARVLHRIGAFYARAFYGANGGFGGGGGGDVGNGGGSSVGGGGGGGGGGWGGGFGGGVDAASGNYGPDGTGHASQGGGSYMSGGRGQFSYAGFHGGDGLVTIAYVPEPSAWSLMLSGLGFLGYVLRRRVTRRA